MTATTPLLLTTWALRDLLQRRLLPPGDVPGLARQLGFDGIETLDRQYDSFRPGEAGALAQACRAHTLPVVHDINCDLTLADPGLRRQQIGHVTRHLGVARMLGAQVARICLGGQDASVQALLRRRRPAAATPGASIVSRLLTQPLVRYLLHRLRQWLPSRIRDLEGKLGRAVAALEELQHAARRHGVKLAIENHWGISTRPEWILRTLGPLDSAWVGTCVDFGNFPRDVDPYEGIETLLTRALHVQAKSLGLDRHGQDSSMDMARCMELVRASSYRGPVGIEYEGAGCPVNGCLRLAELVRHN